MDFLKRSFSTAKETAASAAATTVSVVTTAADNVAATVTTVDELWFKDALVALREDNLLQLRLALCDTNTGTAAKSGLAHFSVHYKLREQVCSNRDQSVRNRRALGWNIQAKPNNFFSPKLLASLRLPPNACKVGLTLREIAEQCSSQHCIEFLDSIMLNLQPGTIVVVVDLASTTGGGSIGTVCAPELSIIAAASTPPLNLLRCFPPSPRRPPPPPPGSAKRGSTAHDMTAAWYGAEILEVGLASSASVGAKPSFLALVRGRVRVRVRVGFGVRVTVTVRFKGLGSGVGVRARVRVRVPRASWPWRRRRARAAGGWVAGYPPPPPA